ncbi:deoxyuridine 5'-triphosphate nucleotidohydrolase, mitochondrial-like [Notamacropus eugenii]|uniref:deoxyuridine 5'-triphosphate nucleotidohydrolase, mitochondrial-like n=1 Tax=Notamacropus eugenii TaxID=9315 RepID=UPI003B66CA85
MEKALVNTNIQMPFPLGSYGRIAPCYGLASKHFLDVGSCVIDEDYRGNVGVILFNFDKETVEVKKSNWFAQLICEQVFHQEFDQVQGFDDTEQGAGGFG